MKTRILYRIPLVLFLMALVITISTHNLLMQCEKNRLSSDILWSEVFRRQLLSAEMINYLQEDSKDVMRDAGLYLLETSYERHKLKNNYDVEEFQKLESKWKKSTEYDNYMNACIQIWSDIRYFPIPVANNNPRATVSYVDSWMYERNYREDGIHEGTDIMADLNKRGYYPVVSMTDGTITNLGWLELGGYRVGVTTNSGAYFYYAHLASYANIQEGMHIKAGELLGYMGDTGYGKEEGTVGKFPVHLHVGIYLYPNGKEMSVNPYAILRYAEKHKLSCDYL